MGRLGISPISCRGSPGVTQGPGGGPLRVPAASANMHATRSSPASAAHPSLDFARLAKPAAGLPTQVRCQRPGPEPCDHACSESPGWGFLIWPARPPPLEVAWNSATARASDRLHRCEAASVASPCPTRHSRCTVATELSRLRHIVVVFCDVLWLALPIELDLCR